MTDSRTPDTPRNRADHDSPHMSPVTPSEDARTILINRISWGAVLAGAALALVIQLVLNLLGIGIGAATLDPGSGDSPSASSLSIGAGIWFAVTGILAALIGGYAAGRLSGKPKESTAGWHGLTAWAVSTLVVFYLLTTTIGSLIGGTFRTIGSVASTVGSTAATATEVAKPGEDMFSAIEEAMRTATGGDTAGLSDAAVAAVRAALTGGADQSQEAREQAVQAIAKSQNVPIEQARTQVAQYEQQYRQTVDEAKQTATEVADTATTATSTGALLAAISLLLGALASWIGGRMGAVEPTLTSRHRIESSRAG